MSNPSSRRRLSFRTVPERLRLSWILWLQKRADRKRLKQEQKAAPLRVAELLKLHLEQVQEMQTQVLEIQERHSLFQVELAKRQVALEEQVALIPKEPPPEPKDLEPLLTEQREMLLELLQATHPPVDQMLSLQTGPLTQVSTPLASGR